MPIFLDGGMGHLLKCDSRVDKMGLPYGQQFLASVLASFHCPDVVKAAHRRYLDAGCTAITTNSFAATPYHFKRGSISISFSDVAQV
jgi:S-methylmethionine-dependent homocysteine/selenocysteine methylase